MKTYYELVYSLLIYSNDDTKDAAEDDFVIVKPEPDYYLPPENSIKLIGPFEKLQQNNNILFQSTTQPGAIYKFDADTGEIIGELYPDEPYEHGWGDLAFDGTYLWHINVASDMIYKIDQYTGAILDQFPAPSNQCEGLTFDGWYLWVSDTNLDILYQIEIEFNFLLGDINEDGILNILDIVLMVNMILSNEYSVVADVNEDGFINILDIVLMVNILVGGLPQSN